MHRILSALSIGIALALHGTIALALPTDFSFQGTLSSDDDVVLITFMANGTSTVTLVSYSYAGGVQADGTAVPNGGFDPILALFDQAGNLIDQNDDGFGVPPDPFTGAPFDTLLSAILPAGSYTVSVSQYNNFANGPTLADGFFQTGNPTFTVQWGCSNGQFCDVGGNDRTSFWAFDVLNVETAEVPEPALAWLGIVAICAALRSRPRR